MPSPETIHVFGTIRDALNAHGLPPIARLWLITASTKTDHKGRTRYTPAAFANEMGTSVSDAVQAVTWLGNQGHLIRDHNDDGDECLRLAHHDWDRQPDNRIGGYHPNAGQVRDGLPPAYGRSVADAIGINPGPRHRPPPSANWRDLVTTQDPT